MSRHVKFFSFGESHSHKVTTPTAVVKRRTHNHYRDRRKQSKMNVETSHSCNNNDSNSSSIIVEQYESHPFDDALVMDRVVVESHDVEGTSSFYPFAPKKHHSTHKKTRPPSKSVSFSTVHIWFYNVEYGYSPYNKPFPLALGSKVLGERMIQIGNNELERKGQGQKEPSKEGADYTISETKPEPKERFHIHIPNLLPGIMQLLLL